MEWTILDTDSSPGDSTGVEGFIKRMDSDLRGDGVPLEGFRIIKSGMEMYEITRQIEADKVGAGFSSAPLYVGFQNVDKFNNEVKRYSKISEAGVTVVGFGRGAQTAGYDAIEQWVDLQQDHKSFENQWYLISLEPEPFIFIGWETSEDSQFGLGGVSASGKEFKGFISDDVRLVQASIAHLEQIRQKLVPPESMDIGKLSNKLGFSVNKIMVLTDENKDKGFTELRDGSITLASNLDAEIVSYDKSAISYLVNPYPSELHQKEYNKPLTQPELLVMGRQYLADEIRLYDSFGVKAKAILPTDHGFAHLASWAKKEEADIIMIPSSLVRPGLVSRVQGYTLDSLMAATDIPVLVLDTLSQAKVWTNASKNQRAATG